MSSDSGSQLKLSHQPCNQFVVMNQTLILKGLGDSTVAISTFMVMIDITDALFEIGVFIFTTQTSLMIVETTPRELCYAE